MSADAGLPSLSRALGAPTAIVNLRGEAVAGDAAVLYSRVDPQQALRRADVVDARQGGREYRVAGVPMLGFDARLVGSFVTVRDISGERASERTWLVGAAGAMALLFAATVVAVFAHLRSSFSQYGRALEVLTSLSRGDTSVRIDVERPR